MRLSIAQVQMCVALVKSLKIVSVFQSWQVTDAVLLGLNSKDLGLSLQYLTDNVK